MINNPLNELNSREWIQFTKTWFILNPQSRDNEEIIHLAKYPEEIVQRFVRFFTKSGDIVFDPFLGVGSTLVASLQLNRGGIGFELNEKYYNIALRRCNEAKSSRPVTLDKFIISNKSDNQNIINLKSIILKIFNANSLNITKIWREVKLPLVDFCITSPPYWNQLKRNSLRQLKRKNQNLDVIYSDVRKT